MECQKIDINEKKKMVRIDTFLGAVLQGVWSKVGQDIELEVSLIEQAFAELQNSAPRGSNRGPFIILDDFIIGNSRTSQIFCPQLVRSLLRLEEGNLISIRHDGGGIYKKFENPGWEKFSQSFVRLCQCPDKIWQLDVIIDKISQTIERFKKFQATQ
jgi:hypothetical protein